MKLTPSAKIIIGWAAVISVGLFGFTVARDSVIKNRKSLMDIRKRIREQTQAEKEAEIAAKSSDQENKSNASVLQ